MQRHFSVLRQSFCRKFKLSAGSGSQGIPAFRMFAWQVVLRGHFKVLLSLPFQKYKHVGPICNKAVFVYLFIHIPWVKAIDHTRILPPADLLYLYLFPRYDHLKITKGTTSISSERAKMKEYTNFTVPRSFLLEL